MRRLREAEGELVPDLLNFALERWGEPYIDAAWSLFANGAVPLANAPGDREFDATFIPWFLFDFCGGSVKRRNRRRGWPKRPAAREYLDERRPDLHALQTRYLEAALGVVVLAWGATSAAATWVASRIGGRLAGVVVALLLAWALIFNLTMLPYTMWFKVVMFGVFPVACLLGLRYSRRVPSPAAVTDPALRSR